MGGTYPYPKHVTLPPPPRVDTAMSISCKISYVLKISLVFVLLAKKKLKIGGVVRFLVISITGAIFGDNEYEQIFQQKREECHELTHNEIRFMTKFIITICFQQG